MNTILQTSESGKLPVNALLESLDAFLMPAMDQLPEKRLRSQEGSVHMLVFLFTDIEGSSQL